MATTDEEEGAKWCQCCGRHISTLKPVAKTGKKLYRLSRSRIPHLSERELEIKYTNKIDRDRYMQRSLILIDSWECENCRLLSNQGYFLNKGKGQSNITDFLEQKSE
jgi:hypothetical protein